MNTQNTLKNQRHPSDETEVIHDKEKWALDNFGAPQSPLIDISTRSKVLGNLERLQMFGMDLMIPDQIDSAAVSKPNIAESELAESKNETRKKFEKVFRNKRKGA